MKILLLTDTICDANGVSRFIQDYAKEGLKRDDIEFLVVSSTNKCNLDIPNIQNIKPSISFQMPFYKELDITIPSYKKIKNVVKEFNPDVIALSTPGFVGLMGRIIADKYNIDHIGVYHTDFPAYTYQNTKSKFLKNLAIKYMRWFYKRFKIVFVRSDEYLHTLKNDIKIENIENLKAGIDLDSFDKKYRDLSVWEKHNIPNDTLKFIYVGRLTTEKNFDFLLEVFKELEDENISLVVVGTGEQKPQKNVHYLGFRDTDELQVLYASSDVFVFPSITDTLGQVVMESMASELPAVVSNIGGPKMVVDNSRGAVLEIDKKVWVDKLKELINSKELREELGRNAYEFMRTSSVKDSFDDYIEIIKKRVK
jgi:glycosyltransferase involved in cell wall biosynthesis